LARASAANRPALDLGAQGEKSTQRLHLFLHVRCLVAGAADRTAQRLTTSAAGGDLARQATAAPGAVELVDHLPT